MSDWVIRNLIRYNAAKVNAPLYYLSIKIVLLVRNIDKRTTQKSINELKKEGKDEKKGEEIESNQKII